MLRLLPVRNNQVDPLAQRNEEREYIDRYFKADRMESERYRNEPIPLGYEE
jgi:hypothetical protein